MLNNSVFKIYPTYLPPVYGEEIASHAPFLYRLAVVKAYIYLIQYREAKQPLDT